MAIAAAFALITFGAYWFLGPQETAYSFQVSQANNIIHGHLDLRPEYTLNLGVLEQVLYDGKRFCLRPDQEQRLPDIVEYADAIQKGATPDQARALVISPTCKTYMQHSLGPSFMVLPGVLIWGKELNQVLVSVIIGALTSVIVYAIARRLSSNLMVQLALTGMLMFGTILWWVAADGSVWMFAHTTAVFFLFAAIYFTLVRRQPLVAGALFGAAFLCRPTALMGGLFFVVMFSEPWLKPETEHGSLVKRLNWFPAAQFLAGLVPFILLNMALNYIRYDNPLQTGYDYVESAHQTFWQHQYVYGTLDIRYIGRHPPVIFGALPVFRDTAPYVLPSWLGLSIWATTPAFLYAFFIGIKSRWLTYALAAALALAMLAMTLAAASRGWDLGPFDLDLTGSWNFLPFWDAHAFGLDLMGSWEYLPFYAGAAVAVAASVRLLVANKERLVIACWAAIIPTALVVFSFAFVGYAQFGYRYGLDFYPFLWLLVARAIGNEMRWHHWTLIGLGVAVSLWGVLWIYQFEPEHAFGVSQWVTF